MFWDDASKRCVQEFRDHPDDYLRQPTIRKTLHPDSTELVRHYWYELVQEDFFVDRLLMAMRDPPTGMPYKFGSFPKASPLSVQHAYYLNLIQKKLGVFVPELKQVTDVGGGYGNLCRLVHSLGFSGRYNIADIPVMHELQRGYLGETPANFITVDQIRGGPQSILMGTFSIGEMPIPLRESFESRYAEFDYFFLSYHEKFEGADNHDYFRVLRHKLGEHFDTYGLKDPYRGAWFLMGKRR